MVSHPTNTFLPTTTCLRSTSVIPAMSERRSSSVSRGIWLKHVVKLLFRKALVEGQTDTLTNFNLKKTITALQLLSSKVRRFPIVFGRLEGLILKYLIFVLLLLRCKRTCPKKCIRLHFKQPCHIFAFKLHWLPAPPSVSFVSTLFLNVSTYCKMFWVGLPVTNNLWPRNLFNLWSYQTSRIINTLYCSKWRALLSYTMQQKIRDRTFALRFHPLQHFTRRC